MKFGSQRLMNLLPKIEFGTEILFLDCYNQRTIKDLSGTITTRIDACNHYYILEPIMEPFMWRECHTAKHAKGGVFKNGIAGAITSSAHEYNELLFEPVPMEQNQNTDRVMQVGQLVPDEEIKGWDNPQRGRVFSPKGVAPACCTNLVTKIVEEPPLRVKNATEQGYLECPTGGCFDFNYANQNTRRGRVQEDGQIAPAITSQGQPPCLNEGLDPEKVMAAAEFIQQIAQHAKPNSPIAVDIFPDGRLRPHIDNESNYGIMDFYVDNEEGVSGTQIATRPTKVYGISTMYRIRKLTEREVGRLMDVDDIFITMMIEAGISKSQLYKCFGNSIVVSCLDGILEQMFFGEAPAPSPVMTLF